MLFHQSPLCFFEFDSLTSLSLIHTAADSCQRFGMLQMIEHLLIPRRVLNHEFGTAIYRQH